jgi:hypothetical protein
MQLSELNYLDRVATLVQRELGSMLPPGNDGQRLARIYALLVLVKGPNISVEDVHDAWSTWMTMSDPGHKSLRPFDMLDEATQAQDVPYLSALRRVALRLSKGERHSQQ